MRKEPLPQTLILSKGSVFYRDWSSDGADYPDGATTQIVFYSFDGTIITTVDGTVTAKAVTYLITDLETLDAIPGGAQYELFVTTADGPYKLEYGFVLRRQAAVWNLAAKDVS